MLTFILFCKGKGFLFKVYSLPNHIFYIQEQEKIQLHPNLSLLSKEFDKCPN